jgi:GH25 family lysozyme M1 (1,4-beta-N-acetylmuramidase)
MGTVRGIDVSRWQGDFDWKDHPGLSFGMCKATEGTELTDPEFGLNWDKMWWYQGDHRFPRFAYHFFHAGMDPVQQAEFLVLTAKRRGLQPGDNFVLDLESTRADGSNDGLPPATVAARATAFLHTVNEMAPGHRVLVYSYPAFIRAGNCAGLDPWFLWIANYLVSQPEVPAPWSKWTFWQDGDSPLDTDRYNGDLASLLAFTRMPDKR